jgi:phosphoribosylaminoimidazole carboxylase
MLRKAASTLTEVAEVSIYSGSLDDARSIKMFSEVQDYILIENEFLDPELLAQNKLIPSAKTILLSQNKLSQKKIFCENSIPTADFTIVKSFSDLSEGVLKTARGGYDGKGTFFIDQKTLLDSAQSLIEFIKNNALSGLYLEKRIAFKKELAMVFCQTTDELFHYPLVETIQSEGTCLWVKSLPNSPALTEQAFNIGQMISKLFQFKGVFAVEFFLDTHDKLLVNEIAPRVHNSGHFTLDACPVSQFEAHVRASLDLPLQKSDFEAKTPFVMMNFLGRHPKSGTSPSIKIYDYGKRDVRPKRKMGHANLVDPSARSSDELVERMKREMK